jgi:hypothetical protein
VVTARIAIDLNVARARKVAADTFRDTTPTPSVVPGTDGEVCFIWRKNGMDVEIEVSETSADIWVYEHGRDPKRVWDGSLADHRRCCAGRVLDALERERPS